MPKCAPTEDRVGRPKDDTRLARAIAAIDAVHSEDPNRLSFSGDVCAKELLQARRASYWIGILEFPPSEVLQLAARAHHLRRWCHPRSEFPEGRPGYHAWRRELQNRHAIEAGRILLECGYAAKEIERVGELIRKRGLGRDPEVQILEDALCLVFIETELASFAAQHSEEKVIDIIARSLAKMSAAGRTASDGISLGDREAALVSAAARRFAAKIPVE